MNEFALYVADALADCGWSNDVPVLETQDYWNVFTYSNRRGKVSPYFTHSNSDAEYTGIGWTCSSIYSILKVECKSGEFYLGSPAGTDRILGEVWSVPTEMLLDLDCEERNLLRTKRVMVPINLGATKGIVSAWMYQAHPGFLRDGGIKVSKYTTKTYYGQNNFLEVC
jgi:gamma-glutamylcyclotransferase (GGCT)/AIG2-like uncharacterized protein YtfP